jgi:hypothetical protein
MSYFFGKGGIPSIMKKLFDFLTKLKDKFDQARANEVRPCDELWEAVDLVVKLSHPNIHYVPHYREKLMPAVEHTLKFANELIVQMPEPLSVEADSWDRNPFIRTVFSDVNQFRNFFSENKELKEFFQKTDHPRCCALLVMDSKEKKIFGVEMDGDIIKRDVLQTSIDFSNHQIVAPMISEEDIRKELSMRALSLLATYSLEQILSLIAWKKEMETEKHILEVKLQIRHARVRSRNSLLPDISDNTDNINEASEVLGQLDRKIAQVREELDEPEDYLNKVAELLYHPEQFLRAEPVRMMVNDMNIIIDKEQHGKGDEIRFTELSTSAGVRKATVLVDYKRF